MAETRTDALGVLSPEAAVLGIVDVRRRNCRIVDLLPDQAAALDMKTLANTVLVFGTDKFRVIGIISRRFPDFTVSA